MVSTFLAHVPVDKMPAAQVLGNPSGEVLGKFKRNGAAHVDFNFAPQKGIGVAQLVPHAPPECVDLITKVRISCVFFPLDNARHDLQRQPSIRNPRRQKTNGIHKKSLRCMHEVYQVALMLCFIIHTPCNN